MPNLPLIAVLATGVFAAMIYATALPNDGTPLPAAPPALSRQTEPVTKIEIRSVVGNSVVRYTAAPPRVEEDPAPAAPRPAQVELSPLPPPAAIEPEPPAQRVPEPVIARLPNDELAPLPGVVLRLPQGVGQRRAPLRTLPRPKPAARARAEPARLQRREAQEQRMGAGAARSPGRPVGRARSAQTR